MASVPGSNSGPIIGRRSPPHPQPRWIPQCLKPFRQNLNTIAVHCTCYHQRWDDWRVGQSVIECGLLPRLRRPPIGLSPPNWYTVQGLAWSPDGNEVWFTSSKAGIDRSSSAVSMTGKERLVTRMPGTLMLLDIWKNGKILMTRASWRRELISIAGKDAKEKDLSCFDYSTLAISPRMARHCCLMKRAAVEG